MTEIIYLLLKGMGIGFSIAAPVGPIGVLCIQKTIYKGRLFGLVSGLGAAFADGIYGCIAGLGLTCISSFLISAENLIKILGGIFLLCLGIKTFLAKTPKDCTKNNDHGLKQSFISTFLLTLTNPMTIISYTAVFAGLEVVNHSNSYSSAIPITLGVFLGSAFWWTILSSGVSIFRKKFRNNTIAITYVNKFSGIVIGVFGATALVKAFL